MVNTPSQFTGGHSDEHTGQKSAGHTAGFDCVPRWWLDELQGDEMGDEPYSAILPWVVFAVVARGHGLGVTWAAVAALITAATMLATQRRSSVGTPNVLAWGAIAWFSGIAVAGLLATAPDGWLAHNSRAVSAAGFTLIALASLTKTPVAEFYLRPHTRQARWHSAPFERVNVYITMLWAAMFAAMSASHMVARAINTSSASTVFNWVVPIAFIVIATHRTRIMWDDYLGDEEHAGHADFDPLWDLSLDWNSAGRGTDN
jgi:MFS family permease